MLGALGAVLILGDYSGGFEVKNLLVFAASEEFDIDFALSVSAVATGGSGLFSFANEDRVVCAVK